MSSKSITTTLTPEQIQIRERERRERRTEQQRRRRQKHALEETPEQRRQRLERECALKKKRRSKETPEERRKRLDKELAFKRKKQSEETPEERRKRLDKDLEFKRRKQSEETPEQLERLERIRERNRICQRKRREVETPEEKRKRLDRKLESRRRCIERRGRRYTPEEREKNRFYAMMRKISMTEEQKEKMRIKSYFWYQANKERLNSDEAKKRRSESYKRWMESLTGEKKRRRMEAIRKSAAISQRKAYANATPEELLRRKRRDKVNNEKRKLRRKLEQKNVSVEEIELQLRDLKERMWKDFYPDGDVPLRSKMGGLPKQVEEVDALSTDIQFPKEQSLATFEQAPNYPFILGAAHQTECSGTFEISCQKENYQDVPQVASTEGGPYITSEHWIPGSNNEDAASPSPLPSPPSSPPSNIQHDEETLDPIKYTTDIRLPCPHCDVTFPADQQLRSHIFSFHSKQCWKCPKCKQVMLSPQELSQHYTSTHKIIPPQNSTKDVSPSTGNYLCLKCPPLKWFETRQELFIHVKQQHSSNFWPCVDCHVLKYSGHAIRLHHTVCQATPGKCDNAH